STQSEGGPSDFCLDVTDHDGFVRFRVRVVPRARASAIQGVEDGVLAVRLQAPPVEGKANEALRDLLAGCLDVRKSAVSIRVGEKSRHKTVEVTGVDGDTVRRRLAGAV